LRKFADSDISLLLPELLRIELRERRQKGEKPTPEEYQPRFPAHTDLIAIVFNAAQRRSSGELESGVTIGDFCIEKRIGAGGMGIVYLARQVSLNRLVALKVLGSALTDRTDIARFQREAQAIAKLNHPGIAGVHFVGQDGAICYIAIEYIDGMSLRELMKRLSSANNQGQPIDDILQATSVGGAAQQVRFDDPTVTLSPEPSPEENRPVPDMTAQTVKRLITSSDYIRRCCEIVRDAAVALAHAHERGVIHRDIKPENILLDRDGKPHLIDFGLARFYEDVTLTNTGALVGTPLYMSPEQVTGRLKIDQRTDIYSLGLVLYEMLTLSKPFSSPSREGILRQIVTKAMVPVGWKNKALPRDLESVVHKATARDPDERYESALALADDIGHVLGNQPTAAKPYRYKFDGKEIAAERPREIIYVSFLFMSIAIISIFSSALNIIIELVISRKISFRSGFFLWPIPLLVGILISSIYLLSGWRWARSAVSLCCILLSGCILYVYITSGVLGRFYEPYLILPMGLVPALLAPLLYRRPIRDWLNFCEQLRLEHERLKVSAH
jgi:serine/threonine protein kinase